jgi:putative FmdB family regulatory protein
MPFYDLKCSKCDKEFNIMAKVAEREKKLIKCPDCGNDELDAVFNNVNIIRSKKSDTSPVCENIDKCGGCCPYS